jgi:hypothetical protein
MAEFLPWSQSNLPIAGRRSGRDGEESCSSRERVIMDRVDQHVHEVHFGEIKS